MTGKTDVFGNEYGMNTHENDLSYLDGRIKNLKEHLEKARQEAKDMTDRVIPLNMQVSNLSLTNSNLLTELSKKDIHINYLERLLKKHRIDPLSGDKEPVEGVRKLNIEEDEEYM